MLGTVVEVVVADFDFEDLWKIKYPVPITIAATTRATIEFLISFFFFAVFACAASFASLAALWRARFSLGTV